MKPRLPSARAAVAFALVLAGCNRNSYLIEQPDRSDTFVQTSGSGKSDILFVINNTDQTMVSKATTLGSSASGFLSYLTSHRIDFHIAVSSMDLFTPDAPACTGAIGSQGCFNGTPRVIDGSTPNLLTTFQANLQVGFNGDPEELGLDAGLAAVTAPLASGANNGFLRSDARLFVIYVSDEDDNASAPGNPLAATPFSAPAYLTAYAGAKGGVASQVVLSAIAGPMPSGCGGGAQAGNGADAGAQYDALITASHGLFESICDTDYTHFLTSLGYQVVGSQSIFPLSMTPSDPAEIVVTVDGNPTAPAAWSYDAPTNSVVFAAGSVPPPGSTVVIRYPVA